MPNPPRRPDAYGVAPPTKKPAAKRARSAAAAAVTAARQRMRRYPVWSVKMILAVFVVGTLVAAPFVFWFGQRRLLQEMEVLLAIVAAGMFLFLAVGLFRGVRIRKREEVAGKFELVGGLGKNWGSGFDLMDLSGSGGCGDIVGGIILGIVLLVVLVVGIWLFINVALIVFFLLSIAVGWVFQRALRQVFAKSRVCRGKATTSLLYAAWYTFLYTGWLFALLMLVDRMTRARA